MFSQDIDVGRLKVHLRCRAILPEDVFRQPYGTEMTVHRLFHTEQASIGRISVFSFGGKRALPLVRLSAALTAVVTIFAFHWSNPLSPVDSFQTPSALARRPVGPTNQAPPAEMSPTGLPLHAASPTPAGDVVSASGSISSSSEATAPLSNGSAVDIGTPEPTAMVRADNKTGVYLTAGSMSRTQFLDDTIAGLKDAGGSALIFDVKGGAVLFHSAAPLAKEIDLIVPFYELGDVLKKLRDQGIYTIGRFVAIKDGGYTAKKPASRVRNPKTGKVISRDWIDPSDESAIAYNMEILCELAAAGIDEVNLDYIRFSTADVGASSAYTGQEKADKVEEFIKASRETINRCGPQTKLGISTYAILGWNYPANVETLGQDVVRFAPLVDVISPMAYPATFASGYYYRPGKDPRSRMYYLVYRTLTGYADVLGPEQARKLRPWIQGYGVTARDVTDEIDAVYDAGYCGFTVWNANNAYKPTFGAIKSDKTRPERCRM